MRKKINTGYFVRGAVPELMTKYHRKSPHFLWRIATSGGLGLSEVDRMVYDDLWTNRLLYFRADYLDTFEANDKVMERSVR